MRPRLLAAVLAAGALLALPAAAQAASTTLVINEIDYDQPGTDAAEYLEIRNVSAVPINLGTYTLELINGEGNPVPVVYVTTPLPAGNLAAGDYFVVCANTATVANCDLDINPDSNLIQNGAPDAARLVNSGTVVDTVSYEGATTGFSEGAGAPADTGVGTQSIARVPDGCDRDNNSIDFRVDDITPGAANDPESGCPTDTAPSVASSDPANGQTGVAPGSSITVTFSEPVTAMGAFSLECGGSPIAATVSSSSDQTTYTVDPATDLPRSRCRLTVDDASVHDVDLDDPPDTMASDAVITFFVAGIGGLRIHDIQGRQHRSPYDLRTVVGVPGVVTAVSFNGFWMQDPQPDGDRRTSEGIFVFTGSAPRPAIGTAVTVSGLVEEFRPGGDPNNLTTTEISNATVTPAGTGTIAPTKLGKKGLRPPLRIIDNDSSGDVELNPMFDPWQDGIDFHESLEGMLVQICKPVVVGPTNGFDELPVVSDGSATPRSERDGVIVRPDDFNPERFILDDGMAEPPDAHVGDGLVGPVRAVVDYSFGNFKYLLTSSPARIDNGLEREVTQRPGRDELSVGSMNVENLTFVDRDESKYERLARILVENMRSPDIVAVEEIQDNDGTTGLTGSPVTDATQTWNRFIAKIAEVGGPEYEVRQIDPVDDQDGGAPGGNIRVGFLFRTDRGLEFVDRPGGTPANATAFADGPSGPRLTFSPGRLQHPTAFTNSRKPLVGEFRWRGETVFAVANHFNSKGGDQPLFGRFQPPNRVTEPQRHEQAMVVRDFVRQGLRADRRARVIVLGDLNDFEFSRTLEILEDTPMVNLMETLDRDERYSYVFEGNSQTLDQILVTHALRRRSEYDSVHVNAEFFDQASDHDPQVARLTVDDDSD